MFDPCGPTLVSVEVWPDAASAENALHGGLATWENDPTHRTPRLATKRPLIGHSFDGAGAAAGLENAITQWAIKQTDKPNKAEAHPPARRARTGQQAEGEALATISRERSRAIRFNSPRVSSVRSRVAENRMGKMQKRRWSYATLCAVTLGFTTITGSAFAYDLSDKDYEYLKAHHLQRDHAPSSI